MQINKKAYKQKCKYDKITKEEDGKMGRMYVMLSDVLERKFREEVFKRYGMKKGNIAKAVEEAIKDWIEKGNP
jgi:hypothetical protein